MKFKFMVNINCLRIISIMLSTPPLLFFLCGSLYISNYSHLNKIDNFSFFGKDFSFPDIDLRTIHVLCFDCQYETEIHNIVHMSSGHIP